MRFSSIILASILGSENNDHRLKYLEEVLRLPGELSKVRIRVVVRVVGWAPGVVLSWFVGHLRRAQMAGWTPGLLSGGWWFRGSERLRNERVAHVYVRFITPQPGRRSDSFGNGERKIVVGLSSEVFGHSPSPVRAANRTWRNGSSDVAWPLVGSFCIAVPVIGDFFVGHLQSVANLTSIGYGGNWK